MKFSGQCYDGPMEGQTRGSELPWFEFPFTEPLKVSYLNKDFIPPASIELKSGFYRWSYPLRQWVFVWDNKPSRYGYTG
jgi:hypothetical protein